jgi:hypothetical protein
MGVSRRCNRLHAGMICGSIMPVLKHRHRPPSASPVCGMRAGAKRSGPRWPPTTRVRSGGPSTAKKRGGCNRLHHSGGPFSAYRDCKKRAPVSPAVRNSPALINAWFCARSQTPSTLRVLPFAYTSRSPGVRVGPDHQRMIGSRTAGHPSNRAGAASTYRCSKEPRVNGSPGALSFRLVLPITSARLRSPTCRKKMASTSGMRGLGWDGLRK